ncbi:hypothetical protein F5X68DRAFT_275736 [Plectosphaerella plurivora]|uniref:Uncharacterized protein n=1 Tax=Plectosphaerella plurivora TaxID=936078 RepID=A0A9P9ABQ6_9PEZI|nr:hypothetical protein F5X68DRAFT_275736 [Plectosphaerella plurivora]
MSSDAYRRVGRGGAGNYLSKETVDKAEAQADNLDLEKQSTNATAAAVPHKDQYARAGRGGAGNFVDPATLPNAQQQEEAADRTKTAVNASIARTNKGYSGRGGAGNWTNVVPGEEDTANIDGQEELQRRVVEDVERGLARPDKVHTPAASGNDKEDA